MHPGVVSVNPVLVSQIALSDSSCSRAVSFQFTSVQSLSRVRFCDPMNLSTPGLPIHHQLLEFTQTHVHQVGDAIQPSHPLSSPSPPAPNPSQHQSFNESTLCMRWPKYWSFSFSIIPSKAHPGLISFRMDWLDLLAVHGILKSLLQQYSFYRLPNNRIQVPCLIDKAVDMPELCSFDLRL